MANDEPTPGQLDDLDALLSNPAVWDDPPAGLVDDIVAAISAEAGSPDSAGPDASGPRASTDVPPTSPARIRAMRRWLVPVLSGVAAAVVVIAGFALFSSSDDSDDEGVELALAGTELAPGRHGDGTDRPDPHRHAHSPRRAWGCRPRRRGATTRRGYGWTRTWV